MSKYKVKTQGGPLNVLLFSFSFWREFTFDTDRDFSTFRSDLFSKGFATKEGDWISPFAIMEIKQIEDKKPK